MRHRQRCQSYVPSRTGGWRVREPPVLVELSSLKSYAPERFFCYPASLLPMVLGKKGLGSEWFAEPVKKKFRGSD